MISNERKGFTLIELMVVIAIISFLSSIILASMNSARQRARDAKRLGDINQILLALEMYYDLNDRYPGVSGDSCCDGWDQGPCGTDPFIGALETAGLMSHVPVDPLGGSGTSCYGYSYHRYNCIDSGSGYPCYGCTRPYFVLGVRDMESSGRPHSTSPGWDCPLRDWQSEFDWVTGDFE